MLSLGGKGLKLISIAKMNKTQTKKNLLLSLGASFGARGPNNGVDRRLGVAFVVVSFQLEGSSHVESRALLRLSSLSWMVLLPVVVAIRHCRSRNSVPVNTIWLVVLIV